MKVIAKDKTNAAHVAAAKVATTLLNRPNVEADINKQASDEIARQLIYGLPPSEGMPDVRPHYPRFEPCRG